MKVGFKVDRKSVVPASKLALKSGSKLPAVQSLTPSHRLTVSPSHRLTVSPSHRVSYNTQRPRPDSPNFRGASFI
ncbi:hypothetical protein BH11VER1_BH11VER1_21820 [soil metagenome]